VATILIIFPRVRITNRQSALGLMFAEFRGGGAPVRRPLNTPLITVLISDTNYLNVD